MPVRSSAAPALAWIVGAVLVIVSPSSLLNVYRSNGSFQHGPGLLRSARLRGLPKRRNGQHERAESNPKPFANHDRSFELRNYRTLDAAAVDLNHAVPFGRDCGSYRLLLAGEICRRSSR
jgi:hypothetical protein